MIYLLASILSSVLIAVIIRINESGNLDRLGIMLFNYLIATALGLLLSGKTVFSAAGLSVVPLSFLSGFFFVSAFLVYMLSVRRMGLAVPVTVTRLSVVIPVVGSLLFFSESLNFVQVVGLAAALIAIYLFSRKNSPQNSSPEKHRILLPLLLFLLIGMGDFSLKIFQGNFPDSLMLSFIISVFAVSSVYTLILVICRKVRIDLPTIAGGILLGIPNFFSAYFILKVLRVFPGAIAFPLNNIGIILLSTFAGIIFWKEKLNRRSVAAICIAVAAVILMNIQPS